MIRWVVKTCTRMHTPPLCELNVSLDRYLAIEGISGDPEKSDALVGEINDYDIEIIAVEGQVKMVKLISQLWDGKTIVNLYAKRNRVRMDAIFDDGFQGILVSENKMIFYIWSNVYNSLSIVDKDYHKSLKDMAKSNE